MWGPAGGLGIVGARRRLAAIVGMAIFVATTGALRADETHVRIVTFGTSLTASGGWQDALAAEMSACLGTSVSVAKVARNGVTSEWGLVHIGEVIEQRPDVVLVEFAMNDAALNRFITPWRSRANLDAILARLAAGTPRPQVFVMAMNPALRIKWLSRPFLDTYVGGHRRVALAAGAGFIDHRPAWRKLGSEIRSAIPDGTHPLPQVATLVMVPEIVRAVSGGRCAATP